MKKKITLDTGKKVFPILLMIVGIGIMLAQWILRLNLVSVVAVAYCCIMSAVILLSLLIKKKVYAPMVFGYAAAVLGVVVYFIIWGADAGFGAFSSGLAGYASADHPWAKAISARDCSGTSFLHSPRQFAFGGCSSRQNTPSKKRAQRKRFRAF